jgi:hypothetical protein
VSGHAACSQPVSAVPSVGDQVSQPESLAQEGKELLVAYPHMVLLSIYKLSRDSSVGIATDYGLED